VRIKSFLLGSFIRNVRMQCWMSFIGFLIMVHSNLVPVSRGKALAEIRQWVKSGMLHTWFLQILTIDAFWLMGESQNAERPESQKVQNETKPEWRNLVHRCNIHRVRAKFTCYHVHQDSRMSEKLKYHTSWILSVYTISIWAWRSKKWPMQGEATRGTNCQHLSQLKHHFISLHKS